MTNENDLDLSPTPFITEVYGDITRRYPTQIHRILIRNVDDSTADDARYKLAFKNIARRKWRLFDQPTKIAVEEFLSE